MDTARDIGGRLVEHTNSAVDVAGQQLGQMIRCFPRFLDFYGRLTATEVPGCVVPARAVDLFRRQVVVMAFLWKKDNDRQAMSSQKFSFFTTKNIYLSVYLVQALTICLLDTSERVHSCTRVDKAIFVS